MVGEGWTVAATLVLVWMAVPSTQVMVEAYDDAEGEINILITGHQWQWPYEYLEDEVGFSATYLLAKSK